MYNNNSYLSGNIQRNRSRQSIHYEVFKNTNFKFQFFTYYVEVATKQLVLQFINSYPRKYKILILYSEAE